MNLLLIGRLITALGAASGLTCCLLQIHELYPPEQAKTLLSYAMVSFTVGISVAVALGGIISTHYYWGNTFYILFIHGITMFALTGLFKETLTIPQAINIINLFKQYRQLLKHRLLIIASLLVGFTSTIAYAYSAAAPLIAHHMLSLSPEQYGVWNLMNTLGMLAGGVVAAHLMKRLPPRKLLLLALFYCFLDYFHYWGFNGLAPPIHFGFLLQQLFCFS